MSHVIIIGGGTSGLATANLLQSRGHTVEVLERQSTPGGNVRSTRESGWVLDHAANGWLDSEPAMTRLLERLGLGDRTVAASDTYGTRWIYADGMRHPAPMSPPALLRSRLIPWRAKLRLLLEPLIRRGPDGQSVGAFVERRLGRAFVQRMIGPMVAGIYAADPHTLELEAAFPRLAALEKEYRSLFVAMMALRRGGSPRGHLETLPGGAGALTEALAASLGGAVHCDVEVDAVEARHGGWVVHTTTGPRPCDAVVLCCPAPAQARLVRGVSTEAASALDAIPYAPATVVVTGWADGAFPTAPDGFGVLMARDATIAGAEGVLGTVFSSAVFPDQAPTGHHLARTIIGGAIHPEAAALDEQHLLSQTRTALQTFLGPMRGDFVLARTFRHPRGIPQYAHGHRARVARIRSAQSRHRGLVFSGNHLEGVGVKDCARAAEVAADAIDKALG